MDIVSLLSPQARARRNALRSAQVTRTRHALLGDGGRAPRGPTRDQGSSGAAARDADQQ